MRLFIFFLILFAVCSSSYSVSDDPNKLEGTWQVDLRPTPESEPYFKDFEITLAGENSFNGKFYDTEFSGGRLNSDWSKIFFWIYNKRYVREIFSFRLPKKRYSFRNDLFGRKKFCYAVVSCQKEMKLLSDDIHFHIIH